MNFKNPDDQHKLVRKQLEEAKKATDRLFDEGLDKVEADDDMNSIGKFLLNAVDLREKTTKVKVINTKALAKAKRLSELLKRYFPDATTEMGTDEILDMIYVECFCKKGIALSGEAWKEIYPLIDECDGVSAIVDDFDSERAGLSFGFSPLYFRVPKTK